MPTLHCSTLISSNNRLQSHATIALMHLSTPHHHRTLITIAGPLTWTRDRADVVLAERELAALWVGDDTSLHPDAISLNASRRYLGREVEALVYDAHAGFDPNVLALLAGTVKAGGALLLLCPPLAEWAQHEDTVNKRCTVWGMAVEHSRYLVRLARLIPKVSQLLLEHKQSPQFSPQIIPSSDDRSTALAEQQEMVAQVVTQLQQSGPQLAVIQGDRGRGKSAALGLVIDQLLAQQPRRIIVCAPRRAAAEVLFAHADIDADDSSHQLHFVAPDKLCLEPQDCELLVLDEMGGIHVGLLTRLLALYPRLLMAGTTHGYEGAGRGFHTRLRRQLEHTCSHARWYTLHRPIRWAEKDPLESSINALLLLDAEHLPAKHKQVAFSWLDRDELAADEDLLRQLHGLLAGAHYRTRPLDLRQMLDGPNMRVAVMVADDVVVAACLLAVEGPIDDAALCENIMAGKRRPAGHLLPQILLQYQQLRAAADMRYWRIVRIAVQSALQGTGIGSKLLHAVEDAARQAHIDCLGTLFALDAPVLRFWSASGYWPAQLGTNVEATSGSYAITLLKPLSAQAYAELAPLPTRWAEQSIDALTEARPALDAAMLSALEQTLRSDGGDDNVIMGG